MPKMAISRILVNCNLRTFNPDRPQAEALALRGGVIAAVGSRADILNLADASTNIEDLEGKTVLPAFCDAHIHLMEYGFSLLRVDCETTTRTECMQRLRHQLSQTTPGAWVLGHGWNHNIWPEGIGSKQLLDEISPENPIYLTHKSLHSAWANSAALKIAGIMENSFDPQGGQFARDENGRLTGILLEGAMRVVEAAIPQPDQAAREHAILTAQQSLLEFGITSLHDFDPWECYMALAALEEKGKLKLRVMKGIPLPNLEQAIAAGIHSGEGSDHLTFGWLKLFADGALGPQTAAMLNPYEGSTSIGMLFLESAEIVELGRKALPAGISMAVHAIGDRANREVINGYAQLNQMGLVAKNQLPLRIEHVQLLDPRDMQRLAEFRITASMQPIHAPSDRLMADRHWGNRCAHAYAWKTVKDSGAALIFGSDAPVESPNPYWGLQAALSRKMNGAGLDVPGWYPQLCLPLEEALQAYIAQPQVCARKSSRLGMLAPDNLADLVVFSKDLFQVNTDEISRIKPDAVMSDGNWVVRRF